jgi:hypothetical protein
MPDLNATIKFINAIVNNWCGYTIKSGETRVGSKGHQIRKKTYWIHRVPPNGAGFETIERIMAIKLNNPNYHNETQELFDSIPITTDILFVVFIISVLIILPIR